MAYSRRNDLTGLTRWLVERGYEALRVGRTQDRAQRQRVEHVLLRRRPAAAERPRGSCATIRSTPHLTGG